MFLIATVWRLPAYFCSFWFFLIGNSTSIYGVSEGFVFQVFCIQEGALLVHLKMQILFFGAKKGSVSSSCMPPLLLWRDVTFHFLFLYFFTSSKGMPPPSKPPLHSELVHSHADPRPSTFKHFPSDCFVAVTWAPGCSERTHILREMLSSWLWCFWGCSATTKTLQSHSFCRSHWTLRLQALQVLGLLVPYVHFLTACELTFVVF